MTSTADRNRDRETVFAPLVLAAVVISELACFAIFAAIVL
jgi:hypothetical protein